MVDVHWASGPTNSLRQLKFFTMLFNLWALSLNVVINKMVIIGFGQCLLGFGKILKRGAKILTIIIIIMNSRTF